MKTWTLALLVLVVIGCQSGRNYHQVQGPAVPAVTHESPKNPIDVELINWKPYGKNVDKTSQAYQEYAPAMSRLAGGSQLKKRIIVAALDDSLKAMQENFKMALYCSDNFVVMERALEPHAAVLRALAEGQSTVMKELADALQTQYLLLLTNDQWMLCNLLENKVVRQEKMAESKVLGAAETIVQNVTPEKWQGKIVSQLPDNKVVLNSGSLDGLKQGDTVAVAPADPNQQQEETIILDEVEDKYATGRIMGDSKQVSKGMKVQQVKS